MMGHYDKQREERQRQRLEEEKEQLRQYVKEEVEGYSVMHLRFIKKVMKNIEDYKTLDRFLNR